MSSENSSGLFYMGKIINFKVPSSMFLQKDPWEQREILTKNPEYDENDILTMCTFYFTRGTNNLEKIMRTSNESDRRVLDKLIKRYSLVSKGYHATTMNLSRIAKYFPEQSVLCLDKMPAGDVRRPISLVEMGELLGVSSFPQTLTTTTILSIIPHDENLIHPVDANKIYMIVLAYAAQETPVINPAMASKSFSERFYYNRTFAVALYKSKLFTDEERFEIASKIKGVFYVENGSLRLLDHINKVYDCCMSYLKAKHVVVFVPITNYSRCKC
ncbi:unnamed protein product [Phyllotreta striolata]|uniref:Uncharacterized protein n=1 Tax=Phyllotreta striolata TaxID=444603 RepID=A0A9N9TMW7_PHYSR|nr:unnamed protein product [Phyllotreta striolata]